MLRLTISSQPIKLEYTSQNAQLDQQTILPKLQLETTPATVEIHQSQGELTIDQTPCRYSIGLKNISDFSRDIANQGKQAVLDTIGSIAEDGDRMGAIENKGDSIAQMAADSTIEEPPGITLVPIDAPIIRYEANPVQFNPTPGKINYFVEPGTVNGDYHPGSVDFRITQYPSVQIGVVDVNA